MKTCYVCKKIKDLDEFCKNKSRKDGYQDECKACRKAQKARIGPVMLHHIRHRARVRKVSCDLDLEWIKDNLKRGCAMSGLPFKSVTNATCAESPSFDRIDPRKGYTKDNTRLVLMSLNSFKGSSTDDEIYRIAKAFCYHYEL